MVIGFRKQFVPQILAGIKKHTLRDLDPNHPLRWKPGMKMHQATGVRTKNYNCFNVETYKSYQRAFLLYGDAELRVLIDGRRLDDKEKAFFIKSDGFKNETEFIQWFFPKGEGDKLLTLLHWTDLRY